MLLGRIVRVLPKQSPLLRVALLTWLSQQQNQQVRWAGAGFTRSQRRPSKSGIVVSEGKSEWWVVDGEMHEIGDHIPHRERFVIPRDNLPNRRRKQMREQFMRRTRLVLKESEHEQWCKRYMELYNELRENSERLYWDEGYSKQVAEDHANYESSEDDDLDFSPYRRRQPYAELNKDQSFGGPRCSDSGEKVRQIRDMFEYDRERKMREKAFAPMNASDSFSPHHSAPRNQLLVARESNASDSANPHKSTPRYKPFDSRKPIASDSFNPGHSAARNQPLSASINSAFAPMNASDSFSAHHSIGWESNASDSFNPHKSAPRNPPFDARKSSASDNFDPHHPAPRNHPLNASKNSS